MTMVVHTEDKSLVITTEPKTFYFDLPKDLSKLLNDSTVSKFVTRKQMEVNDLLGGQHYVNKNIRFKTPN